MLLDDELKLDAKENHIPISLDETISFVIDKIKSNNYKTILEVGTAIGYGCISIATNTDCEHIDSLEIDKEMSQTAIQNIDKKNVSNVITIHNIDAKDYINTCTNTYDFIYLDGPKGQYLNYLPILLDLLNDRGMIVADNLFFHGMVTGKIETPVSCRAMIKGLHRFINEISLNKDIKAQVFNIGDGIAVITKL